MTLSLSSEQEQRSDVAVDKIRDEIERYNRTVREFNETIEAAHAKLGEAHDSLSRAVISLRVTAHSIGEDLYNPEDAKAWRSFHTEPPPFPIMPRPPADYAAAWIVEAFENLPR